MPTAARLAPLALAAALGACSYSYGNFAETLAAGEVSGRTVDGAVLDGVAVSLRGSVLTGTSRGNGRFALLPLPAGHHTLVFRRGSERAAQLELDVGFAKDGKPQGFWLGDVAVPASVGVAGTCTLPGGAALAAGGLAVDEVSGATAVVSAGAVGSFAFQGLAAGPHRIRIFATDGGGTVYLGGPLDVDFSPDEAGLQKILLPETLRPRTASTGTVSLRVGIVGAPDLALADLTVAGLGPLTIPPSGSAQLSLAEGLWTAALRVPPARGVSEAPPLPRVTFIVLAGETVDLGTLWAVADASRDEAEASCDDDSDCDAGSCSAGVCVGFTPPDVAPACVPFCDASTRGCTAGAGLGATTCVAGTGLTAGVPCGGCCTPDGVQVLCSEAGAGGCPP